MVESSVVQLSGGRADIRRVIVARYRCLCVLLVGIALGLHGGVAHGASSSTVVGATVPSATELDLAACATGTSATSFGIVTPGSSALTPGNCVVSFGSSNDTSSLRLAQADGEGSAMWRLPDGALDTTFQGDGIGDAVANMTSPAWARGGAWDVGPDRRMYVAAYHGAGTRVMAFQPDGSFATGWNGTGTLNIASGGSGFVAVRSDGRVYVATQDGSNQMQVRRYLATGAVDTSCGGTGMVTVAPPGGFVGNPPVGIELDEARGRVYVAGAYDNGGDNDLGIAALDDDDCASVGSGFSGDGQWQQDFGSYELVTDIVVAPDGDLNVVGYEYGTMRVARINADGSTDLGFNGTGTQTFNPTGNDATANAGVLDAQGRLLIAGYAQTCGGCDLSTRVVRLLANGQVDPAYGTAGHRTIDVSATGDDTALAITLDSDGNAVVAGATDDTAASATAVLRLDASGTPDASFDSDGIRIVDVDGARSDRASMVREIGDGRLVLGVTRDLNGTDDRMVPVRFETRAVAQYLDDTRDWLTPGTGHFGACLQSTTGSATWSTNASCTTGSDPWWREVSTSASVVATESSASPVTATLRFGFRSLTTQPPGRYVAPVQFTVVAP